MWACLIAARVLTAILWLAHASRSSASSSSVVEGINTTIKVIKRRAYGYRDQDYFFLKIRAAFPAIAR